MTQRVSFIIRQYLAFEREIDSEIGFILDNFESN